MYGAIIGDIVGSRFEFDRGNKSRDFKLFGRGCEFTDDTVMTVAVAEALLDAGKDADEKTVKEALIRSLKKWGKKYPLAAKSWIDNWTNLSTFFEYEDQVRKIIYTTNPIEGMHRQIRKITKSKGAFSSEQALMKLMYQIIKDISKKWTMPVHNWGLTISQLYIKFGDGLNLDRGF